MKLIKNSGSDRVIDELRQTLGRSRRLIWPHRHFPYSPSPSCVRSWRSSIPAAWFSRIANVFMKLIKNTGSDRVIDELRQTLAPPSSLDLASPAFSLFAFAELRDLLEKLDACRVVLPAGQW